MSERSRLLIVDDEKNLLEVLTLLFTGQGSQSVGMVSQL